MSAVRTWAAVAACSCCVLTSAGRLLAQEPPGRTGTITGRVVDAVTREALGAANVSVVGTLLGAVTDSAGGFVVGNVPPGEYAVRASLVGYSALVRPDVVVTAVRPAELEFALQEAAVELEGVSAAAGYSAATPEFPVSVRRQSAEEIRRQPGGFEDVLRAVAILPGVAQPAAGRNDLIVRGGAPSENLYLLDGIGIPNINHFGTQGSGGGPLSYINLDFVDNTVFSSGGFGPRYGDRLSSVLSIALRDGRKDRVGGKLTLSATQFGLNLEGPAAPGGSFLFSARRSYLDFIFKGAGFGFVPEYWDFTAKWKHAAGPKDEIRVVAVAAIDDVNFFNDTPGKRYDNSKILGSSQRQAAGGAVWQRLIPSGFLTVTLGQSYTDFSYSQRDTLGEPLFLSESIEHESSLGVDVLLRAGEIATISGGVEGKRVRSAGDLLLPPFGTAFGDTLEASAGGTATGYKAAAYAQVTRGFGRLTLNAGVRLSRFDLPDATPPPEPRLSMSLDVGAGTTISASAGRYTQSPSLVWLAANPRNRSLGTIRADQAVIGVEHAVRPDTRVTIEAYVKRYAGYPASLSQPFLVLSNTGAGYGGSEESFASFGLDPLVSAGTGRSRGIELSARKYLSEVPCYGLISASLSDTRYTALDGIERPSSYDQRLVVNVGGGYAPSPVWEVSAKFRLATGRPYTPFNADGTKSAAAYNGARLAANHSLDVRIDRRWFFASWSLVAYLDIQNIYNRKPAVPPTWDERTGTIAEDDAIGILPSIGLSGEF